VQQHACSEAPFIERTLRKDAVFAVRIFHLTLCPDVLAEAAVKFPDDWRIASELAAWADYGPPGGLAVRRETIVLMDRMDLSRTDPRYLDAWHSYLDALYRLDLSKQFVDAMDAFDPASRDALMARPTEGGTAEGGAALIDEYVAALLDLGRDADAKKTAARYGTYDADCTASKPGCLKPFYRALLAGGPVAALLPAYWMEIGADPTLGQVVARRLKAEGASKAAADVFPQRRPDKPVAQRWAENEKLLRGLEPDYSDWKQGFEAALDARQAELVKEGAGYRLKP
jgi:hypothetical protein